MGESLPCFGLYLPEGQAVQDVLKKPEAYFPAGQSVQAILADCELNLPGLQLMQDVVLLEIDGLYVPGVQASHKALFECQS